MNRIFKVTKQEFKMTAANKAFVVITIIGPFLILALAVLPGLLSMNTKIQPGTEVAVVGAPDSLYSKLQQAAARANIVLARANGVDELSSRINDGTLQGILVIPPDYENAKEIHYYSKSGTDMIVSQTLGSIVGTIIVSERLTREGLDPGTVAYLSSQPTMVAERISKSGMIERQDFASIMFTTIGFVMLIYMTVLLYGQMIGRSIVVEKTSKTVEIMLSSVKPVELLFGKILGKGLAGLLQYAIWVSVAVVLIRIVGPAAHVQAPPSLNTTNLLFLVMFFVLAFFLYSAAYGALGAGAEDEQHLGQLAWPLIIFLVLPMVMIGSLVMNPNSSISLFLAFFPLTSPIVMLMRVLIDMPPAWELLLCVAILIVTIIGVVYLAAKIFRVGILMTGKRFSIGDILKWVRY